MYFYQWLITFSIFQLFMPDGEIAYLDCVDQSMCNWMMFVRKARNWHEQNLAAYQYKGAVYYAATKVQQNIEF